MTVKLTLLKSGEDVIADVEEMIVSERVVGYFLTNPCVVKILAKETESGEKMPCKLQLTPWMPLTTDKKIPIAADWLITMVEPIAQLKQMYENGVMKDGEEGDQTDSVNEQSDSDQSD